jgi:phosphatidylinositol glycan class V
MGAKLLLVRAVIKCIHIQLTSYRNVGFLKYWTVSNIPLFLSATPALMIMTTSAIDALRQAPSQNTARIQASSGVDSQKGRQPSVLSTQIPWRFALPQLILASLATTNYHVQIITRISSGYIVWYWWIASLLTTAEPRTVLGMKWNASKWVVRWMVIYSLVQAGLFASFLPPA